MALTFILARRSISPKVNNIYNLKITIAPKHMKSGLHCFWQMPNQFLSTYINPKQTPIEFVGFFFGKSFQVFIHENRNHRTIQVKCCFVGGLKDRQPRQITRQVIGSINSGVLVFISFMSWAQPDKRPLFRVVTTPHHPRSGPISKTIGELIKQEGTHLIDII